MRRSRGCDQMVQASKAILDDLVCAKASGCIYTAPGRGFPAGGESAADPPHRAARADGSPAIPALGQALDLL